MNPQIAREIEEGCANVPVQEWRKLKRRDRRKFCQYANLWLTAKTVLDFRYFLWYGTYWGARKYYRGPLFHDMADWFQTWHSKIKICLVAREHNKSQTGMAWVAWNYVRDVNLRALIRAYNTNPKAVQIARGIREILDSPHFQSRYWWVRAKTKGKSNQRELWGNEGLLLARGDIGVRVTSLEITGMEKEPTGGHFHLGLYDDFAIRENETSAVLQPQIFEKFQEDDNLFLAGAQRAVCGTIWAKNGFLDQARNREGIFANMDYDLFYQPGEVETRPAPLVGRQAALQPDRTTISVSDGSLPDPEDARFCQARLTFENPLTSDTDVVTREIVWNDAHSFQLNRPVDTIYTGPIIGWYVGNSRPAAPSRFTMDCVDLLAPADKRDVIADRASLPQKRKTQGPYSYGCQILLNPLAKETLLFDADKLQRISRADFDKLVDKESGIWYRKGDFASAKQTKSFTAITTGFVCFEGVFIRRIFWGLPKTDEILLELFRGQIWLKQQYRASMRHTQMEKAHIENVIGEQLQTAQQNPYAYFSLFKQHKRYAEEHFADGKPMRIPIRTVSRGMSAKMDRVRDNIQPVLEQERLYIVEGIENQDRFEKELAEATQDNDEGVDLLETVADLCEEVKPPKRETVEVPQPGIYAEINRQAMREAAVHRLSEAGYP